MDWIVIHVKLAQVSHGLSLLRHTSAHYHNRACDWHNQG